MGTPNEVHQYQNEEKYASGVHAPSHLPVHAPAHGHHALGHHALGHHGLGHHGLGHHGLGHHAAPHHGFHGAHHALPQAVHHAHAPVYHPAPAYTPAPVYHAAPVYKPAPVYHPAPVVHAAPVYKPAPVVHKPAPVYHSPLLSMPLLPTSPLTQHLLTMSPLMMAQPSTNMVTLSLMTILVPLFLKVKTVMVMLPLVNTASLFPMVVPKLSNTQLGMPTPDTSLMSHTRVRPTMILMCPQRPLLTMPKKHIY